MTTKQENCVVAVAKALGKEIDKKTVKEIVDQVYARARKSPEERVQLRETKLAAMKLTEADMKVRKQALRDEMNRIMAHKRITDELASSGKPASKTLDRMNVGLVDGSKKAGDSLYARAVARYMRVTAGVERDLKAAGLFDDWKARGLFPKEDPELQKAVYLELSRLEGGDAPATGNAKAVEYAKLFSKWNEAQRVELNNAGANIAQRKGYTGLQSHDQFKIAKAGGEQWIRDVAEWADDSMFPDPRVKAEALNNLYTDFATGNHDLTPNYSAGDVAGFKGPGNLAKRLSESRVLIFKSAEAEFAYNRKYGQGNIFENFIHHMEKSSHDIETIKLWSNNPLAMFQRVVQEQIEAAKQRRDEKEIARLESAINRRTFINPSMLSNFRAATGTAEAAANPNAARIASGVRAITSMSKLGGMVLSNFGDIATRMAALSNNGINPLSGFMSGLSTVVRGAGGPEIREALLRAGVAYDVLKGGVLSRFSATDSIPGTMTRMMNTFFRWNLGEWWQKRFTDSTAAELMHNLGARVEQDWEGLHGGLRQRLEQYGITKEDWNTIRVSDQFEAHGAKLLTGEGISDEAIRNKLQLYFMGETRFAMNQGGGAERAFILNFGPAGSGPGEIARMFLQFRMYSMTFARQQLYGRWIQGDHYGLAQLIVASTLMGYASMVAKDLAKGKTPRDPSDPAAWGAAFLQGGGAGIYGDFLLGGYDRFGQSLAENVAGPNVATASDWIAILARFAVAGGQEIAHDVGIKVHGREMKRPDLGSLGEKTLTTTVNTLPGANLFYTRTALDYLILYQLGEMMKPGMLQEKEQRLKQQNNQTYLFPPSKAIPYGGGNRIFEGVR